MRGRSLDDVLWTSDGHGVVSRFFFYRVVYLHERILGHRVRCRGWNFYNVMNSWACQRAPLHCCVSFSPFLPLYNMLERVVSLVITGDLSKVPSHMQLGFSLCSALYQDGSALLWLTQERQKEPEAVLAFLLSFFLIFWSAACKHQWHAMFHLTYICDLMWGTCERFPTEP